MICSVIIDNLSAQFHRLDRVLDQWIVLQAKYVAHMTNLVLVRVAGKNCHHGKKLSPDRPSQIRQIVPFSISLSN
jgi:hypothetical protein